MDLPFIAKKMYVYLGTYGSSWDGSNNITSTVDRM
jgi:hypothetical protein